eukprot:TRINITY_DN21781_c0_g1_i1.p1 TRINITY_DN21781_c0_g1~~TRINITY_DN21781_c0_g1_i1.p1  ORF type:complete len:903 (-),score=130.24 TRINITY_DN21781_c0_g1_i1:38-2707(-)
MAGFDFWRLPALDVSLLTDSDDDDKVKAIPTVKGSATPEPQLVLDSRGNATTKGLAEQPPPTDLEVSKSLFGADHPSNVSVEKPSAHWELLESWTTSDKRSPNVPALSGCPEGLLQEVFCLDTSAQNDVSGPGRVASFADYLCGLRLCDAEVSKQGVAVSTAAVICNSPGGGSNQAVGVHGGRSVRSSTTREDSTNDGAFARCEAPVPSRALAPCSAAQRLAAVYGPSAVPSELLAYLTECGQISEKRIGAKYVRNSSVGDGATATPSSGTATAHVGLTFRRNDGSELFRRGQESARCPNSTAASGVGEAASVDWRWFYGGSLLPIDSAICGPIRPVPTLPNPLTISTDVQDLVEQMLADIPPEDWDAQRLRTPEHVEGFPKLCHGPGGLLPSDTPRQMAQNAIAAALLNRLCGNVLSTLSARMANACSVQRKTPEEIGVVSAQEALDRAHSAAAEALVEEKVAVENLSAFRSNMGTDEVKGRELESMVGWKSSVVKQASGELVAAKQHLQEAEAALESSRRSVPAKTWHSRFGPVLPSEASTEPLFAVRLGKSSPILYTVKDFLESMQHGFMDRTGGGFVTKHAVEAAFVRHAVDNLLLCVRTHGEDEEASQEYIHLPVQLTVNTGILDGFESPTQASLEACQESAQSGFRTIRPHHGLVVRLQGQSLTFSVTLTAVGGRSLGFVGCGIHPVTYSSPWNPIEYGDVLWQHEAMDCFGILPTICVLSACVGDAGLPLGIFPPLHVTQTGREAVLGTAGLALLQAALFNDVKLWPVSLPDAARSRWDYAMRAVRNALSRSRTDDDDICPLDPHLDSLEREVLPRCVEALAKVPNDSGSGDALGCRGFVDRLKRMEMSALTHSPLLCARKFLKLVDELSKPWQSFSEECAA